MRDDDSGDKFRSIDELFALKGPQLKKLFITIPLFPNETDPLLVKIYSLFQTKNRFNKPDLIPRLVALVMIACLTQGVIDFLLSRSIFEKLIKSNKNIGRHTISGEEIDLFFAYMKENDFLKVLSPPSKDGGPKAQAGTYRLLINEVREYVEKGTLDGLIQDRLASVESAESNIDALSTGALSDTPDEPQLEHPLSDSPTNSESNPNDGSKDDITNPESDNYIYHSGDEVRPTIESSQRAQIAAASFLDKAKEIAFDYRDISGFCEQLILQIHASEAERFNAWGDYIGRAELPHELLIEAVNFHIKKRFKDLSGQWSSDGEIAKRVFAEIMNRLSKRPKPNPVINIRHCSPKEWQIYQKVAAIREIERLDDDDEFQTMLRGKTKAEELKELGDYTAEELEIYQRIEALQKQEYQQRWRE